MKKLITCLTVSVLSGATFADVWSVDDDGKADFDNIQAAVDAASDGDEIVVMPGTYTSTANEVVDMRGKAITLKSNNSANETIIDGEGVRRGIVCNSGESVKTRIENLKITNGMADGYGGGIFIQDSSPTIVDCSITNSTSRFSGGGIAAQGSNSSITDCYLKTIVLLIIKVDGAVDYRGHHSLLLGVSLEITMRLPMAEACLQMKIR